jgi:hypothetical protein
VRRRPDPPPRPGSLPILNQPHPVPRVKTPGGRVADGRAPTQPVHVEGNRDDVIIIDSSGSEPEVQAVAVGVRRRRPTADGLHSHGARVRPNEESNPRMPNINPRNRGGPMIQVRNQRS